MKLFAAVALFGFAAIKASPIPDGLFDNAASEDCEDIVEPAELPDIDAPFIDVAVKDESPDCEGEAIAEETILDIQPAFSLESTAYDVDDECVDEATPAPVVPTPGDVEPPCYDDDASNEPVEEINAGNSAPIKDEFNPLESVESYYDSYGENY